MKQPSPPLSKGELTRQRILAAAKELVLTQGYSATSMRQIARAAHITPAAIYVHFSGKEEIFDTLLAKAAPVDEWTQILETATTGPAEVLLENVLRRSFYLLAGRQDYIQLALIDAQERNASSLAQLPPRVFPAAVAFYQRLQALDAGRGPLRDLHPMVFTRTLISLILGYLLTERVARLTPTLQTPDVDLTGGLLEVFLHGVLRPTDQEE